MFFFFIITIVFYIHFCIIHERCTHISRLRDNECYCIVLYYIVLYCVVLYRIVSYRIVSYRIVSRRVASHRIVSYRIVSYRIVLYCIVSSRRIGVMITFKMHS